MNFLLVGIVSILERLITWFATRGFKFFSFFMAYLTITVAGYLAFLASSYALINTLIPLAPDGVGFGLSLLPPSTGQLISAYMVILTTKRVYDFHKSYTKDFTQAALNL
jgi:hypothetical protein